MQIHNIYLNLGIRNSFEYVGISKFSWHYIKTPCVFLSLGLAEVKINRKNTLKPVIMKAGLTSSVFHLNMKHKRSFQHTHSKRSTN